VSDTALVSDTCQDTLLAATLFALDPPHMGGICIKAHAGPVRTLYLEFLRSQLRENTPYRKLPLSIQDERLLGGLDLAATLNTGKPVLNKGVLAEVHNGVLVVPMAERISPALAARLSSVMDRREVLVQREGLSAEIPAAFGLILLDESVEDDERVAPELIDRIAFMVDLTDISHAQMKEALECFSDCHCEEREARRGNPAVDRHGPAALAMTTTNPSLRAREAGAAIHSTASDEITTALCSTAMALGIPSIRTSIFARRAAELAGQLYDRNTVTQEDAALAARIVLSPRATIAPIDPDQEQEEPPSEPPENQDQENENEPPENQDQNDENDSPENPTEQEIEELDDVILEAARAAIPAGLLAQLLSDQRMMNRGGGSGKAGALKKGGKRGRPIGARQGLPSGGNRLSVIDTLRAAAPWQRVRGEAGGPRGDDSPVIASPRSGRGNPSRLKIRAEDFRIKRFREKSETTTIFVVDASGSSALHRLAEAKGAVELLLADCYVRRDQVAVIAFRGKQAEIILPPTRSLVRAKRGLSGLPGGGGTPLALAINAATQLALSIARRGETPLIVMLTDGKANIDRSGNPGREQANADAMIAAKQAALAGFAAMVIDTSPLPSQAAQQIAAQMHARYMPLPHAGAAQVSQAIKTMS
jgi:magnesium chelatase subunit D